MAELVRILAPTDFSPAADRGLRRAALVASKTGGALHLLHVLPPQEVIERLVPPGDGSGAAAFRAHAERALQERAQSLTSELGVTAACELRQGRAHQGILEAAEAGEVSLIVLGTLGERAATTAPSTIGDTVLKVVERARSATLLVRRDPLGGYEHLLACAKGTAGDRVVLEWSNRLGPTELIHVLAAYDVPYAQRLTAWGATDATVELYAARERDSRTRHVNLLLGELGLPAARVRLHIERGEAVKTILLHAARWEADLVVVAKRAHAGFLAEGPFGSVARDVAVLAPMDVLVVPPI